MVCLDILFFPYVCLLFSAGVVFLIGSKRRSVDVIVLAILSGAIFGGDQSVLMRLRFIHGRSPAGVFFFFSPQFWSSVEETN